jgi:hypothetical protein
MAQTVRRASSPIAGSRLTTLIVIWLAVVYLAAPPFALYYETAAAWYTVPPLLLIYAYCLSHRHGASALLAVVPTAVAFSRFGFAIAIPKAASAAASATVVR